MYFSSTTGCVKNGGGDQEDSRHFPGDVRPDIKAARNDGVGVINSFSIEVLCAVEIISETIPSVDMQYCERVTGAATSHQIPLREQRPAVKSFAGDEKEVRLRICTGK